MRKNLTNIKTKLKLDHTYIHIYLGYQIVHNKWCYMADTPDWKLFIWHFDLEKQCYGFFYSKQLLFSSYITNSASLCPKNSHKNRRQSDVSLGSNKEQKMLDWNPDYTQSQSWSLLNFCFNIILHHKTMITQSTGLLIQSNQLMIADFSFWPSSSGWGPFLFFILFSLISFLFIL